MKELLMTIEKLAKVTDNEHESSDDGNIILIWLYTAILGIRVPLDDMCLVAVMSQQAWKKGRLLKTVCFSSGRSSSCVWIYM